MDQHRPRKSIKVGVRKGGGEPPGYQWSVWILDIAFEEAMSFLNREQYDHIARQFRELAAEREPTNCQTVDVRGIEDIYEMREKGGILHKINVRVFFHLDRKRRSIVVLGTFNKKYDGKTHTGDRRRMLRRKRLYEELIEVAEESPPME